ncbi:tyrosine--tRNA ligase [Streptobacillus moniliformis]|uniref:Tyrosine--tRNA ligase n=1 Tax=Streptobacillus moniliformis (strain ATCC 14647 / DSM 12112 / NCTC 10651 / 9901) TaxID=519441 RepID=D1AY05_STRM9|nr:tyrosine--tRNA ligase [Streptobacillus moniliformis]ACZ01181.1 tyrosyl-tRNA synthetase [Streptobacillus moniliformis DSM 12112]AVL42461.1 tyrosine--tRNA ligase [Streptobacillus moniliformis]SQA13667.1 Tyrosine--tRNA ligase [Streptobacillus moniliformis]
MSELEIKKEVERQFEILKRGCDEIISEEEFKKKLENSIRNNKPLKVKLGIDPTGSELHIGHAVPIRKLKQFQDLGHEVNFLIGTFTARIGDPTGKSETRKMLSFETIQENIKTYLEQVKIILDLNKIKVVYNHEWLEKLKLEEVLKLLSMFTVSQMIQREDFSKRLSNNQPVSLIEFTYPILQGYDSVALEADVELGATEQKFNLLRGRDLQKNFNQEQQICMIMPILVGLDGVEKMSKSLGNYISIQDSPNDMFGKIMSISDELMLNYYEMITDLPLDEVKEMLKTQHPMDCKKKLGYELVKEYYGEQVAIESKAWFENVFSNRNLNVELPEIKIVENELAALELLSKLNFISSNSEGRRLIDQGAMKVNDVIIKDINEIINLTEEVIVRCGKKKIVKIIK